MNEELLKKHQEESRRIWKQEVKDAKKILVMQYVVIAFTVFNSIFNFYIGNWFTGLTMIFAFVLLCFSTHNLKKRTKEIEEKYIQQTIVSYLKEEITEDGISK